jgi:hypothetical protein
MVDEADQSHGLLYDTLKADDALKILIRNATEEFGFVPRDVYNGVLNPSDTKEEHANAREGLDWSRLQTLVQTFSRTCELSGLSHQVVAVYPCISRPKLDRWAITFKSVRIAREVMNLMRIHFASSSRSPSVPPLPAGMSWKVDTIN